jgi:ankyrin repeat protein
VTTRELNLELSQAIAKTEADQVRKLIARGADVDAVADPASAPVAVAGETPLWASVSLASRQIALLEIFGESSVSKDQNPRKKRRRYVKIIGLLIDAGADLEKRCHGSTPLRIACIHNDLEVAEILLAKGADPNAEVYSPLSKNAKIRKGKALPAYYGTILHEIVSKGYQGATALLVKAGADPNRLDDQRRTAFDIATEKGGGVIIKVLKKGALIHS